MAAVIWCLGLIVILVWVLVRPGRWTPEQRAPFYGVNHAHRGLHTPDRSVPENSLPAFRAAVEHGYGMELDIQLSKDGQVVVFHDDTLDRVCGVHGRVDAYSWDELREMRLCGTGERIPLFTEVLDTVAGRQPMIVELKSGPRNQELCQKGLALLRDYAAKYQGAFCVESFDPRIVAWFRKHAPDILRGQLANSADGYQGYPWYLRIALANLLGNVIARPQFVAYGIGKKTPLARLCESMGAIRVCWTVRPNDDASRAEEECDAVIFEFYTPKPRYK